MIASTLIKFNIIFKGIDMNVYTGVKFAQGGLISDKIEGLNYSIKSIVNDECYTKKYKKKLQTQNLY